MELAASVGGGCLLGWWVDRRMGTEPWAMLIGSGIGIVGGLYNMIRQSLRDSVRSTQKRDEETKP